ncbi:restriction endonuclease subunit S [Clostridium sp. 'White wine YQ']|uniref:restriction endonuclease subunit S n=1 Tax=Clostridium sp. 'White wine YQ' TaxID=3027474 RepID=UPI00236552B3|nr:restriction endonuclease subunit S [Clostridium sp. 'White wine YQ']MDD7795614.1 restriction endonuclease subunit S [Clostridium sp. 'White wine YQ']
MGLTKHKIGKYIELYVEACNNPNLTVYDVSGVNRDKEFFEPSKQVGQDTSKYKIVPPNYFACNLMHVGRDEVLPIALNHTDDNKHVSPAYTVFKIKDNDSLLHEYFFLMLKSSERDRYFWFHTDSSVRDGMAWEDFCDLEIELPPLPIQQKYVDIYNAMLANQRAYETGLEDLKLTCDAYIDRLRLKLPHEAIGPYIELSDKRNDDLDYGVHDVRGVSIEKRFIDTKADMNGVSLKPYYLVAPDEFAYVTVTSRNGEKISIAHNGSEKTYICSSSYVVFRVVNIKKLLPSYLRIFFSRSEFDRYSRFHSWGSARETFDWSEMCDVKIPIPEIKVQECIVEIYNAYLMRRDINEKLKEQIKDLCPILIKGALEEANT